MPSPDLSQAYHGLRLHGHYSGVISSEGPLVDRPESRGRALAPGTPLTTSSIGSAIATRAIMADLRAGGDQLGGPKPFAAADRSRFLQALDAAVVAVKRGT